MIRSALGVFTLAVLTGAAAASHEDALPSYHYGAPIPIECMNRSSYAISSQPGI
jgi:hypothetical protein